MFRFASGSRGASVSGRVESGVGGELQGGGGEGGAQLTATAFFFLRSASTTLRLSPGTIPYSMPPNMTVRLRKRREYERGLPTDSFLLDSEKKRVRNAGGFQDSSSRHGTVVTQQTAIMALASRLLRRVASTSGLLRLSSAVTSSPLIGGANGLHTGNPLSTAAVRPPAPAADKAGPARNGYTIIDHTYDAVVTP